MNMIINTSQFGPWRRTSAGAESLSMGLHWLMLSLLAAIYACDELRQIFPEGSAAHTALTSGHVLLGLSVVLLLSLRIFMKLSAAAPAIQADRPDPQTPLAELMHLALYALLIGMPLAAGLILSAEEQAPSFSAWSLPALFNDSRPMLDVVREIYASLGFVAYLLIGLHAAVALVRHYGVHDKPASAMTFKPD